MAGAKTIDLLRITVHSEIFSQILLDFKKSISGPIELKFSGKTHAILQPRISSLVGLFLK